MSEMFVLGIKGWLSPGKWPSGLVPISLVAFVIAVIPLFVKRKLAKEKDARKRAKEEGEET